MQSKGGRKKLQDINCVKFKCLRSVNGGKAHVSRMSRPEESNVNESNCYQIGNKIFHSIIIQIDILNFSYLLITEKTKYGL